MRRLCFGLGNAVKKVIAALLAAWVWVLPATAEQQKVLRYSFRAAETGFDPARVSDTYSNIVNTAIFDAPLRWAYLARPFRMEPAGCELPEVSSDFKTLTFKVRPGIYFQDDPAFKSTNGKGRELVAADYVYSIKRHYDPATNSPNLYIFEGAKLLGLSELRQKALKNKTPFDYDTEVEGLKVLDKYTWQIKLGKPDPRFVDNLTNPLAAALAREVVEAYGDKSPQHPVGTNAFMLKRDEWRRSSRIVLVKNPNFREEFYKEEAPADRPDLQAIAQQFKGRRLPMIDRVEIAIIEQPQPRWLSFLNRESDMLQELPGEFAPVAIPHGKLAPNLAARGIRKVPYPNPDINHYFFNLKDPVVGGYEPAQVALRRALSLAYQTEQEIRLVRRGQMVPAQGLMPPGTWGYDPSFKSSMNEYSPAKAKALLDLHGFVDRDGDGWRDRPDGSPLRLVLNLQENTENRAQAEIWEKSLRAIRVRIDFKFGKFPENLKASRAGKLQMWAVAWVATTPDAGYHLAIGYGPNAGQANHARFDLPAFNALYEKQSILPNGPERQQVMNDAVRLAVAYMPYKVVGHRIWNDLAQPWLLGYERNVFRRDFFAYVDIDLDRLAKDTR
ncbi:MAG: bicyclomycin resistance protein [Burkholderiales bacterium]|nr:bicyclomycin resistance protein [Burkholderiales bacterium]